jgi:hypothetical protein
MDTPEAHEQLTVGELRIALARGSSEMTIREALSAIAEQDEISRAHEVAQERYRAYVATRMERRTAVVREAMDDLDHERQRTGRQWPNEETRAQRRRQAGLEAEERFDLDEPLLEFAAWSEAGAPDGRAEGLLARFGST